MQAAPPAAQDARIEAELEILRNYSVGTNEKSWATAIRELITIGKPAISKLTAELDRTDSDLNLAGFGVCSAGDRRPAGRAGDRFAIPRLYPSHGGDCALVIGDDPELMKFMQQNDADNRPRSDMTYFAYSRPIREVMPALEKLTGQSHGWLQLNFADNEGQGRCNNASSASPF